MPIAIVDRCYIAQALHKKHFKHTNRTFFVNKAKQKARAWRSWFSPRRHASCSMRIHGKTVILYISWNGETYRENLRTVPKFSESPPLEIIKQSCKRKQVSYIVGRNLSIWQKAAPYVRYYSSIGISNNSQNWEDLFLAMNIDMDPCRPGSGSRHGL